MFHQFVNNLERSWITSSNNKYGIPTISMILSVVKIEEAINIEDLIEVREES